MKDSGIKRLWDVLNQSGDVVEYEGPLTSSFELSKKIKEAGRRTVFFRNLSPNQGHVVSNLFSSQEKIAKSLNRSSIHFLDELGRKFKTIETECTSSASHDFIRSRESNLVLPPAFKYYKDDYGPYITSSVVLARDLKSGYVNASIHRLLYIGENRYVLRMVEGRHLHRIFQDHKSEGKDVPVAILVGVMPHLLLAAASPLPWQVSELSLASSLKGGPLPVADLNEVDFSVPIESEFVMLGRISRVRSAPEMMTDALGTYDKTREQPVVDIVATYYKEKPLCHAILPGGYEHVLLMGLPRAAEIKAAILERGIDIGSIVLTPGSGGWLHCFISIRKKSASDGKDAILIALNAHRSLKGVIVVDDDIDVNDYEAVDFALATRFGSKDQLVWFEGLRGSTLDPSANQSELTTLKWGLDLTLDIRADRRRFLKSEIPR